MVNKIKMNEKQLEAVLHKSGPLLVIAGAGTGKTRVITERIKNLVEKENIKANEILALTFTEKASQEMSERVGDVMPLGYEEPWIYTFHSFADRILRSEGLEIGMDPSYKILSGPEQWLLLRKHIFKFKLNYFRPLGNPTKFISAILKFISRLQDENISPKDFENFVTNYQGEEKERWEELSHIYTRYTELKIEKSKLDFGDLITWTINLFKERPNILHKYQTQFKHVLLDEFQDTNYAQYELVKMICPQDLGDRSLVAVGDDSQSIYKFRGAAVSNILQFMEDYPEAKMVTLLQNYRSNQETLDPAYKLIQNNNPDTLESKLGISKELVSELGKSGIKPVILNSPTEEDEVEVIISKILEILGKEPEYTYKDFAILARANSHLESIIMALRKNGLPYQVVGNRGLYDREEIRDILSFLKVIINPKDSIALYRVMNISTLEIPYEDIAHTLSEARYKKVDMWEEISTSKSEKIKTLHQKITEFQEYITKATPTEFVYNLVHSIKYISQFMEDETTENQLCIKNLDLFLGIIKKFEVSYHEDTKEMPTIINLVDHLELIIEAGDNPAQAEIEDIDTINLMTVHASKGLEFPVVFMINLVADRFPTRNRGDMIEMPEELIKETLPTGDEHIQEERRLFYVGMTRAKKYLYLTYATNYGGKRDKKPSGYLEETGLKTEVILEDTNKKDKQESLFGMNSGFREPKATKIENIVPSFLSYSQIEKFKTCPLAYKYSYILRIPTPPNHALSFGITIHNTLNEYHKRKQFEGNLDLEDLYDIYDRNWQPLGYLDENHRKERYESGKQILEKYYEENNNKNFRIMGLEKAFNLRIGDTKLMGRIDRIDKLASGGIEIIDYKTGKSKTQKEVDNDSQVTIYAIAALEALQMKPEKLSLYYVETGERITTSRTPAQLEEQKEEIIEVVDKIKQGKFEATPGMICNWCDFKEICPFAHKD